MKFQLKKSKLDIIKCYFPDKIDQKKYEEISSLKYSFVHADFDLYKPTLEVIKFVIPRLEKMQFYQWMIIML